MVMLLMALGDPNHNNWRKKTERNQLIKVHLEHGHQNRGGDVGLVQLFLAA